ncbi:DNA-packaging protein [Pontixanthobacter aquaemixtae]|nr:terminase family protein [Pontixanthobacter aquaemixtae]
MDGTDARIAARDWDNLFSLTAHPGQLPPSGDWRVWLVMGGRGFGKTRAGAEWVRSIAESDPFARIALVATSLGEARSVMVEGESGLIACSPAGQRPKFEPSLHRLRWPNGAQAILYSAAEPESLRGPQHSHAWCDEIGKWPQAHDRAGQCWNNLTLGLRLGKEQRIVATTTPRNTALVRRLIDSENTAISGGPTRDNALNLPQTFLTAMEQEFGNSLLARQELGGELIEEIEGALWSRALLERSRADAAVADYVRIVVAVDPPASSDGDECGIVVAGLRNDGSSVVLADCSVSKASPERWARAVADAAQIWAADRVVAEANQGGAMVASVLRAAEISLPLKLVHASRGKAARAEPVAALYEAGRVKHCGTFAALEDQMCALMAGGGYEGPGRSADRADALVWALTELMLGQQARPRISAI